MPKAKDLTGKRFNRLTAIERVGSKKGQVIWKCQCDCGNISYVSCAKLISGNTKSCGCLNREGVENPRHKDRLYHVWLGMKERCSNSNATNSKWYSDCLIPHLIDM